ncbi:DotU family type IV/VI secretion system protein [Myxococcaceae bacterium GXIMD 01537]
MSDSRRLWFPIASTFSDIQRLCQEARAAELRAQEAKKAQEEASATPGLPASTQAPPEGADIVALRAELRSRLVRLKARLAETLTEREVYYALFPLVIYTDELAQSATSGRAGAWPPLQRELYEIDNGGELFYSSIDILLKREETSPLIFEVFHLCLNDGFLGQYPNSPEKIAEYMARLAAKIPVTKPGSRDDTAQAPPVELVAFPKWYYVIAAAVVLGVFALLHLLSAVESLPTG